MIFITLILALVVTFGVLCLLALLGLEFKRESANVFLLVVVFVVSFIYLDKKIGKFEFCESAVLKICPADRVEYTR
jgi:hypothetical protein